MENKTKCDLVLSKEVDDMEIANVQDFYREFFRRIIDLPPEFQNNYEYSLGFQDKGIKIDGEGSGKIEISPRTVQLKMTPVKARE